ncbi:MAG: MFS transporter [Archangium sp.]|nr:MFS transporter [Archangium sp.]MDP3152379.1 MFS transporter [Archangium sp.]MDP3574068.1 MFS transporter [Archangium sp.]
MRVGLSGVAPWKIGLLASLYFAQGLPFGFQSNALPLYLTELGLTMTEVSLARALAIPWALKMLWAPLVDRYASARFGRRKSWIIPMQLLLAGTCVVASLFPLSRETLTPFLVCVLMMNLFAATQDIAVDGLAVDLLEPRELGGGNAAQVVGYKIGILTGGGLLVGLFAKGSWSTLFLTMAGLCLAVMTLVLFTKEPAPRVSEASAAVSWGELGGRIKQLLARPGVRWLLLAVATYKMGETLADAMFGAWMVRVHHLPKEEVALWLGSWGMIASLAGSVLGGVIATRWRLTRAVMLTGTLRLLPLIAQWAMVAGFALPTQFTIVPLTCAEHFFGGLLTTSMFALMMSSVDRRIGATHFTLLASVEVIGKAAPGLLSGFFVDKVGFQPVFAASVVLSLLFLLVVPKVPEHFEPAAPTA